MNDALLKMVEKAFREGFTRGVAYADDVYWVCEGKDVDQCWEQFKQDLNKPIQSHDAC